MRRRTALAMLGSAPIAPALDAAAQTGGRTRTVAILTSHFDHPGWPAFHETLNERGYAEGRTLRLLKRSAEGQLDRLPALAAELVAARPEVVVAVNTPGTQAAIAVTKDIPIVMTDVGDPIGSGFVTSLARPGGNVTGISNQAADLTGKRLAVFRELLPAARRIAILFHPGDPITAPQIRDAEASAPKLGIEIRTLAVRASSELPETFERMAAWRADGALWLAGQTGPMLPRTIELAAVRRLPVMVLGRSWVARGGLVSYYIDQIEIFRRAAHYVDRILKGAKPAELPVEQPTKFELAINLKTARALGLAVPPNLLARADEVIE